MSNATLRYSQPSQTKSATMTAKIFEFFYLCTVPALQSRTLEEVRRNGVIITGIPDLDAALKNEPVKKYLTINKMVELYKQGVTIGIVKSGDSKDIYDTIQTHLAQWVETLRIGMNIGDAPVEDLIIMDKFASAIYEHAKHYSTKGELVSDFEAHLNSLFGVTNTNFFTNKEQNQEAINRVSGKDPGDKSDDTIPDRESFIDRFKGSTTGLRRY